MVRVLNIADLPTRLAIYRHERAHEAVAAQCKKDRAYSVAANAVFDYSIGTHG